MLTTISSASPRARALYSRAAATRILGPTTAALIRSRQRQPQTRGFRFGPWSCHVEQEHYREMRRRQRILKYKYMESIKRTLSWDQHPRASEDPKVAMRRMMASYWHSGDPRPAGRYISINQTNKSPATKDVSAMDDTSGTRPGQNIEDVERGAMDHLFRSDKTAAYEYDMWQSPLQNIRNYLANQKSQTAETASSARMAATGPSKPSRSSKIAEQDNGTVNSASYIDPITNRRVLQLSTGYVAAADNGISAETFKSYRSQFVVPEQPGDQEPQPAIFSDGPPPPEELSKYRQVKIDPNPTDEINLGGSSTVLSTNAEAAQTPGPYPDLEKYKPVLHGEEKEIGTPEPKYNDLSKYNPFMFTDAQSTADPTPHYRDLDKYGPVLGKEVESPQVPQPRMQELDKYGPIAYPETGAANTPKPPYQDLDKYGPVTVSDAILAEEDPTRGSGDLEKYNAVKWNEPDGLRPLTPEELSKYYTDLHLYGPIRWREPNGTPELTAEEASKQYVDVGKYKPILYQEPDGLPTPEANLTEIAETAKYTAVRYNEPDGLPTQDIDATEKVETAKYQPVKWNEPDGQASLLAEEVSKMYTDLGRYAPIMHNEPDGLPPQSVDITEAAETAKYQAVRHNEPDGSPPPEVEAISDVEASKYQAVRYNEPDGIPLAEGKQDLESEIAKYQPVRYNEPNGLPTVEVDPTEAAETSKYQAVRYNEPDGVPPKDIDLAVTAEKGKYVAVCYNEPDGHVLAETDTETAVETARYQPVRHNEPDGRPVAQVDPVSESLKEFDAKAQSGNVEGPSADGWKNKLQPFFNSDSAEDVDNLTAGQIRARLERIPGVDSKQRRILEKDMDQVSTEWDSVALDAQASVQKPQRTLTGNYVRDFPEDFTRSWKTLEEPVQKIEREEAEVSSFDEPFPRLEPALNRQEWSPKPLNPVARLQAQVDPYSAEPQGLETSYAKECGNPTAKPYVKIHGPIPEKDEMPVQAGHSVAPVEGDQDLAQEVRQIYEESYGKIGMENRFTPVNNASDTVADSFSATEEPTKSTRTNQNEPTVYKILAYDPTMQSINVAETTSIVPDSATALTPAEVLLRLSNPAKFFPHFAPLQAEGYEIISGSGDVLIFRKVRDAQAPASATTEGSVAGDVQAAAAPARVNPIDMTGHHHPRPTTGNFASPTGFVRYDWPMEGEVVRAKPPPPPVFRSMIDVRREEPVFSGPKADPQPSRKKSVGKRMLTGAVWLGGISYAIGVVGEYFKTGGIDGKGPKGL